MSLLTKKAPVVEEVKVEKKLPVVLNKAYEFTDFLTGGKLANGQMNPSRYVLKNQGSVFVMTTPTSNCQSCSISGIHYILGYKKDQLRLTLADIYVKSGKRLAIIEVRKEYMCYVDEKIDKDTIVVNAPYHSTSGNDMVLMIINIEKYYHNYFGK